MLPATTVVWVARERPSDDARRALERWAAAHEVTLAAPAADASRPAATSDPLADDAIEREIAEARDALVALDLDATERHLARAGATLRARPDLPQAAWLRAEVERGWSARWLRSNDEERAKRAWLRAAALDGGRAPGLGERAFDPAPPVTARLALTGPGELRVDGARVAPGALARGAGEHAVAIVIDGRVAWSAWVAIDAGTEVALAAPEPAACSQADLARARLARGDGVDAASVRCERWVAAVDAGAQGLRVATCERGACGPLAAWRADPVRERTPPAPPEAKRSAWPAWATWALAGVAVAGAAAAVVGAASASRTPPAETRFVNGGVVVRGFPF